MNDEKNTGLVLGTKEEQTLGKEVSMIEKQASAVVIANEADFAYAGELTKQVKAAQKKVEEYWEPMRASTYAAYKSVTDHKKDMIDPLKSAEKILKKKIGDFSMEQERKRREQEAEMRRLAQLEMEKKMQEAEEAEKAGKTEEAEMKWAEAEVMDTVAETAVVEVEQPKVAGISKTKAWKITGIDPNVVPTTIAGVEIRPVDEKAVMALIKATKGKVVIPGITFEETVNISVRA